jgi:hypothetical protein
MEIKRETIFIYKTVKGWIARFEDQKVLELFGTIDIPTAFSETADPKWVIRELENLNPGCIVKLLIQQIAHKGNQE